MIYKTLHGKLKMVQLESQFLKLQGQMEPNLAGSIYVRSSIKLNTSHDPLGSGELKIVCFAPDRPLENVVTRNIFFSPMGR
jgi:hypothetical protein